MIARPPAGFAYILAGPTASGKTDAAHLLARRIGVDVLSADSMLVYRGLDIGTAKPTVAQRAQVRYWGVDVAAPDAPYSLALFRGEAVRAAAHAAGVGCGLVVAGGTGLYIKCLTEGLDAGPGADPALRAAWEARVRAEGVEPLRREVERRHPEVWAELNESDRCNPRRLIRALERGAAGVAGGPRSWAAGDRPVLTVLRPAPALLRARIEARARAMYAGGLLDEVRALMGRGFAGASTAAQAIGYAEAAACLSGVCTADAARAETVRRTWQLARRQMTWFRRQAQVRWIEVDRETDAETLAARVAQVWSETGPARLAGVAGGLRS